MQVDPKYFALHFDRLKMVADEAKSSSKLVWRDIGEHFDKLFVLLPIVANSLFSYQSMHGMDSFKPSCFLLRTH